MIDEYSTCMLFNFSDMTQVLYAGPDKLKEIHLPTGQVKFSSLAHLKLLLAQDLPGSNSYLPRICKQK